MLVRVGRSAASVVLLTAGLIVLVAGCGEAIPPGMVLFRVVVGVACVCEFRKIPLISTAAISAKMISSPQPINPPTPMLSQTFPPRRRLIRWLTLDGTGGIP